MMFFNVAVLLACCATIVFAEPITSAERTKSINEIHAILAKLFIPSGIFSRNYRASGSPKKIIEEVRQFGRNNAMTRLVYCYVVLGRISDFCLQALRYAADYSEALDVYKGDLGSIGHHGIWNPTSFEQRVKTFGWDQLLPPQQYHAMACELLKLMVLVEDLNVLGGELKKLEMEWSKMGKGRPYPTTAQIKSNLRVKIDVIQIRAILEKLFVSSETIPEYHYSATPKKIIKEVREFGRNNALPCLFCRYVVLGTISEFYLQALNYAFLYWVALDVGYKGGMYTKPSLVDHGIWHPNHFDQRVENFGWARLPDDPYDAKKYHAMAKALVKLLELLESAWGGSGGQLKTLESDLIHFPNTAEIKSEMEATIKELCSAYHFDDITPLGLHL